jgi:outer membrane murein-binding lipoprotein Lpp
VTRRLLVSAWGAPDPTITPDQWDELETAAGLAFLPEHRARIIGAITEYTNRISHYRASPRASAVKPLLDEIAANANDLAASISKLARDRGAKEALNREVLRSRLDRFDPGPVNAMVRQLARDAKAASEACPADQGRAGDPYVGQLGRLLHQVYLEAGGKGRIYANHSAKFLWWACRLAGSEVNSKPALLQRIKAAKLPFW